jgi:hypothetical protein
MAFLVPDNLGSRKDVSDAVRRVARAFQTGLEEDSTVWFEPLFDPENQRPHFVVLVPQHGVVVLEVVKGKQGSVLGAIGGEIKIDVDGLEQSAADPLIRAQCFAGSLRVLFDKDDELRDLPVGYAAVFTGLDRTEAEDKHLGTVVDLDRCIFKPDLDRAIGDGAGGPILRVFARSLDGDPIDEEVTPAQIDKLRAAIHPDVVIPSTPHQEVLFSAGADEPDVVRVMDRKQEAMAKSLGSGHRVIRGVAGSGKTLVLVARARLLARVLPTQPILVTCYTKSLASQLSAQLDEHDNVEVINLDRLMARVIKSAGMKHPGYDGGTAPVARAALDAIHCVKKPHYRAVLVDEAQDFDTEALEFCTLLLEPGEPDRQDLVIVADSAQNIFRKNFRWKNAGIQAQGRTQILRINYRNTVEILRFAHAFLIADGSIRVDETPDADDPFTIVPAESSERSGRSPIVTVVADANAEVAAVVASVKARLHGKSTARSIAVLYGERSSDGDRGVALARALAEAGVSHFWVADPDTPKNKDCVGIVDEPVILSTVQSAKGLEFKTVIVCGLGMKSDMTTARKLLYVGFTRAVDHLEVITANSSPFASDVVAAASV